MIFGLRRMRIVQLYLFAAAALGGGAFVSGAVAADICGAYQTGQVAGSTASSLCF